MLFAVLNANGDEKSMLKFRFFFHDLRVPLKRGFDVGCVVCLNTNHTGRQPTQRWAQWTNFSFPIPPGAIAAQVTSIAPGGNPWMKIVDVSEMICYYAIDSKSLMMSVVWWGKPWKLYLGWI